MHAIAQYGLGLSIITSALGAFMLCLLVFRYGFAPPDEEAPDERYRRHFVTRLGHAASAVCFAISAGLVAVVLGSPAPRVDASAPVEKVMPAELATLRSEHERLGDFVHTLTARLDEAETAVQRLRATSTDTGAKLDRLERIAKAPRPVPVPTVTRPGPPAPRSVSTPAGPASAPPLPTRDPRRSSLTDEVPDVAGRAPSTVETRLSVLSTPTVIEPRPPAAPPVVSATAPPAPPPVASEPPAASVDTVVVSAPVEPPTVSAASAPQLPTFRKPEPDAIDTAVNGIVRIGHSLRRGLLNAGQTFRRFVEDLQ
jgi:hypothetical protein